MTLEQIGLKLKSAREVSGLSLAQIQEKTKIPYNHLASIDSGNFYDLPEPVYVSGFIRRYAECIGLDAQELVDEYRTELEPASDQTKKTGLLFKNKNNGNHIPAQANYYNRQRIEKSAPNVFKLVPFYAIWIILILVLIVYLVNRQGEIEQNQQDSSLLTLKQSASTIVPAKPTATNIDGNPNQSIDATATTEDATKGSFHAIIKSKNHVWIEVKAISNGEALFNGFIESGDKHDFADKEGLRISAINGSISVIASGKTSDFGAPGKTVEKTFIANKVSQTTDNQTNETENTITNNSSNTTTAQGTNLNKKPVSETTVTKKSTIAATTGQIPIIKPHTSKEPVAVRDVITPEPNAQTPSNKAIDVPYRYSE
jgi:cytoskeletal protein RodZ